jgi:AraC family transcriptional regulator, regulatory protein of adaptative response / methylated-DNA-[protein]-cysteine methyltransferase
MIAVREPEKESDGPTMTDDEKWHAVVTKDPKANGKFYYAVKTTGIYCLPSCPARPALRENIAFYDTPEDAEKAGFRPCKRCWPKGPSKTAVHEAAVAKACRLIETSEEAPSLNKLAKEAGMSNYYFHRVFKALIGATPKEYAMAHRTRRVRQELVKRNSVTEAIYGAGFNSNGRFYAKSTETLGMTPTKFRKGGAGTRIRFAVGECSLGSVLVAVSEEGVCAISLGDDPDSLVRDLQDQFPRAELIGGDHKFEKLIAQVIGFIEAPRARFNLPLDVRGTAFQLRVWQALREIPAGSTVSYTEIAERIGAPKAVRAVAQACASNHIAVAIPCHRVVRNDGALSGYRWGVERKRALLKREAEVK